MELELKLIKDGASANGLRLIGDRTIGYRFVPRSDLASFADNMLTIAAEQVDNVHLTAWCEANKDDDYSREAWNEVGTPPYTSPAAPEVGAGKTVTMEDAIRAGDSVLLNEQAALLRECRKAIDDLLQQNSLFAAKVCGSTTIGNLWAEIYEYRPQGVFSADSTATKSLRDMTEADFDAAHDLPNTKQPRSKLIGG